MAEEDSPELIAAATEAMALISRELDDAAAICVEAGFELPHGIEQVPDDPIERLRWNYHFIESARAWTDGDPDWRSIGIGARLAVELMDAGVRIQIAAHGIKDLPLAGALGLHGYSVLYGAWRSELNRWKRRDYVGDNARATFAATQADTAEALKAAAVSEHMRDIQLKAVAARTPWRPIARTALRAEMAKRWGMTNEEAAIWLRDDGELLDRLKSNGFPTTIKQVAEWIGDERKAYTPGVTDPEAEGLPPKGIRS